MTDDLRARTDAVGPCSWSDAVGPCSWYTLKLLGKEWSEQIKLRYDVEKRPWKEVNNVFENIVPIFKPKGERCEYCSNGKEKKYFIPCAVGHKSRGCAACMGRKQKCSFWIEHRAREAARMAVPSTASNNETQDGQLESTPGVMAKVEPGETLAVDSASTPSEFNYELFDRDNFGTMERERAETNVLERPDMPTTQDNEQGSLGREEEQMDVKPNIRDITPLFYSGAEDVDEHVPMDLERPFHGSPQGIEPPCSEKSEIPSNDYPAAEANVTQLQIREKSNIVEGEEIRFLEAMRKAATGIQRVIDSTASDFYKPLSEILDLISFTSSRQDRAVLVEAIRRCDALLAVYPALDYTLANPRKTLKEILDSLSPVDPLAVPLNGIPISYNSLLQPIEQTNAGSQEVSVDSPRPKSSKSAGKQPVRPSPPPLGFSLNTSPGPSAHHTSSQAADWPQIVHHTTPGNNNAFPSSHAESRINGPRSSKSSSAARIRFD